ncbi:hypothetical protein FCS83_05950 [Oenococcus sp. UCMA 17063]|nr:hypothetical protein [Oenococcus sp. UCMA 17063]
MSLHIGYSKIMVDKDSKIIGSTFKNLRKENRYKGPDLVKGIMSVSSLTKFEAGKLNLSFIKIVQLLDRMHVSVDEFIQLAKPGLCQDYQIFVKRIYAAYYHKDLRTLNSILLDEQQKYKKSKNIFHLLLQATAASLIKELNPSFEVEPSIRDGLCDYLMVIENWGNFQISVFSNCLALLNPRLIYSITKEISFKISKLGNIHNNKRYALFAIVKAIEVLTDHGEINCARGLITFLDNIKISEIQQLTRFKLAFFKNILFDDQQKAIQDNNVLIEALRITGSNRLASSFEEYQENYFNSHKS